MNFSCFGKSHQNRLKCFQCFFEAFAPGNKNIGVFILFKFMKIIGLQEKNLDKIKKNSGLLESLY